MNPAFAAITESMKECFPKEAFIEQWNEERIARSKLMDHPRNMSAASGLRCLGDDGTYVARVHTKPTEPTCPYCGSKKHYDGMHQCVSCGAPESEN